MSLFRLPLFRLLFRLFLFRLFPRVILMAIPLILLSSEAGVAQPQLADDAKYLRDAGVPTDERGLIDFLQTHSPPDVAAESIDKSLGGLASGVFSERQRATNDLIRIGPAAVSKLFAVLAGDDLELSRRAQICLEAIQKKFNLNYYLTLSSATRLLMGFESERAVESLFRVLPFVGEELQEEVWFTLDGLSERRKQAPGACARFLKDSTATRRAAAAYLLTRRGNAEQRSAGARLLDDPASEVRLRVAQALLFLGDKKSIPCLISLLDCWPVTVAWQAEELLHWVAGDDAPPPLVSGGGEKARTCLNAWRGWWNRSGKNLNVLALQAQPSRPCLFFLCRARTDANWAEYLCGYDQRPRWSPSLHLTRVQPFLNGPLLLAIRQRSSEARVVSENRRSTTETLICKLDGTIVWNFPSDSTTYSYWLPSGQILLIDRTESERDSRLYLPGNIALDPRRAWLISSTGRKEAFVPPTAWRASLLGRLHGARELWGDRGQWREVDASGETIWQAPGFFDDGYYLPGGNKVLQTRTFPYRIAEFDAAGQLVLDIPKPGDGVRRATAVFNLLRLGIHPALAIRPGAQPPLADLVKQLASNQTAVRARALKDICKDGPKAASAVPQVLKVLGDQLDKKGRDRSGIIGTAIEVITNVGESAIPTVVSMAQDPQANNRAAAISVVGPLYERLGSRFENELWPLLPRAWDDSSPLVRLKAIQSAREFRGKEAQRLPSLIRALEDTETLGSDSCLAFYAAAELRAMGANARGALPGLLVAARSRDTGVRQEAALAIGTISAGKKALAERAVELLVSLAKDDLSLDVRWHALRGLGKLGRDSRGSLPLLVEILGDPKRNSMELCEAIKVVERLGPEGVKALPRLIQILQTSKLPYERELATAAIGAMGNRASLAIPALRDAARDPYREVSEAAKKVLNNLIH